MKKIIYLLVLSVIFSTATSCENEEPIINTNSNIENFRRDFQVTKTDSKENYNLFIEIDYDIETEELSALNMSEGMLDLLHMSKDEFIALVNSNVADENQLNSKQKTSSLTAKLGTCINDCNKNFTNTDGSKKKGRGKCKGNCWLDAAVTVAVAIISKIK